jgi:hypothetical protein
MVKHVFAAPCREKTKKDESGNYINFNKAYRDKNL